MEIDVVVAVTQELHRARKAYPRHFASAHEGFAVLKEEVDELWHRVMERQPHGDAADARIPAMRREAIQVAAMAIRFIEDVCGGV